MNLSLSIQADDFNLQDEYQRLLESDNLSGAIVTFVGRVRDLSVDKKIAGLFLEYYPGMTEKALDNILQEAAKRFRINAARIIHRVGQLNGLDQIVFVGVTSVHREDAFAAAEFIMDYLKNQAPFWKKEITESGDSWVETKDKDKKLFERWGEK
ncbi:MAG: molybdopterin synthase catalytic subunit MoaE [Cellvibrio sp.]|jgi:molybdopterin synthase catalytic subunit|nr:molybdopterin synthase catalytic subunit MoaE [Cellvibrio sp.]